MAYYPVYIPTLNRYEHFRACVESLARCTHAENDPHCLYFDLKNALKNQERCQTPFTCAIGVLLQIHARLKEIEMNGGVEGETRKIATLAADFHTKIAPLPFKITGERMSNAVTPLMPLSRKLNAYEIFLKLKDEYGIWICPNGGDMKEKLFRVGHIGELTIADNDKLIAALANMQNKGLI